MFKPSQQQRMRYDPVTGHQHPYPSHAAQYREFHGRVAWLYNPWTRARRDARDIGSDVTGLLIASEHELIEQISQIGRKEVEQEPWSQPLCYEPPKPSGPRVTSESIEARIVNEYGFTADAATTGSPKHPCLSLLTIYVLVLNNGYTVVGTSACASPENFDRDLGMKLARENAVSKIWPLEGYLLRENLYHLGNTNTNKGIV